MEPKGGAEEEFAESPRVGFEVVATDEPKAGVPQPIEDAESQPLDALCWVEPKVDDVAGALTSADVVPPNAAVGADDTGWPRFKVEAVIALCTPKLGGTDAEASFAALPKTGAAFEVSFVVVVGAAGTPKMGVESERFDCAPKEATDADVLEAGAELPKFGPDDEAEAVPPKTGAFARVSVLWTAKRGVEAEEGTDPTGCAGAESDEDPKVGRAADGARASAAVAGVVG